MKYLTLLLFLPSLTLASSFDSCLYQVKVIELTKKEVKIEKIKSLSEDQPHAPCSKNLKKEATIAIAHINDGEKLLKKGNMLYLDRMYYTGMGPNGPISGVNWNFKPIP